MQPTEKGPELYVSCEILYAGAALKSIKLIFDPGSKNK